MPYKRKRNFDHLRIAVHDPTTGKFLRFVYPPPPITSALSARYKHGDGRTDQPYNPPDLDRSAHILYSEMTDEELRRVIKEKMVGRTKSSAGRDLQELRKEYHRRRRRMVGGKRTSRHYVSQYLDKQNTTEYYRHQLGIKQNKLMFEKRINNGESLYSRAKAVGGLTTRQEKFCMEYVASGSPLEALQASGYTMAKSKRKSDQKARTMMLNPKVIKRIDNLREEALRRMSWNAEKVLEKVEQVYTRSMQENDFTNANRSMETVARHLGMFVDKSEQKIKMASFSESDDAAKVSEDINKLAGMVGLKLVAGGKK